MGDTMRIMPDVGNLSLGSLWFDELPIGWHYEFLTCCEKIRKVLDDAGVEADNFQFLQVKEKFGQGRIYFSFTRFNRDDIDEKIDQQLEKIVNDFMHKTGIVCTVCGSLGVYESVGWVVPYCEKCALNNHKAANERHKTNFTFASNFKPNRHHIRMLEKGVKPDEFN